MSLLSSVKGLGVGGKVHGSTRTLLLIAGSSLVNILQGSEKMPEIDLYFYPNPKNIKPTKNRTGESSARLFLLLMGCSGHLFPFQSTLSLGEVLIYSLDESIHTGIFAPRSASKSEAGSWLLTSTISKS